MYEADKWYDGSVSFKDDRGTVSARVRVDQPGGVLYSPSGQMILLEPWEGVAEVQINTSPPA